ncbi:hypothetical protein [Thermotalea metallivorans]|uniref:hypothetical protein n=1 Tax=Thermotalea metallivorans TaxID=520762 RepID=UPI0012EE3310|nr:hypothetical protein [Thermotalea metallivorans]
MSAIYRRIGRCKGEWHRDLQKEPKAAVGGQMKGEGQRVDAVLLDRIQKGRRQGVVQKVV